MGIWDFLLLPPFMVSSCTWSSCVRPTKIKVTKQQASCELGARWEFKL